MPEGALPPKIDTYSLTVAYSIAQYQISVICATVLQSVLQVKESGVL